MSASTRSQHAALMVQMSCLQTATAEGAEAHDYDAHIQTPNICVSPCKLSPDGHFADTSNTTYS
ncbi:hypothetical protein T11_15294 [Trichinella zimbabwensis]|uniref:Uncharacterized protein n=1 Tax=Trichinella zimbabwensis TaxID=268475 RepID=A0A0V1HLQ5_9BILA|nr:hypothetical protein T11_15294 [Trichinella zimbabwensis]